VSRFEGSYLGDAGRIDATTRMECGVCWWVYDPAAGDSQWQIAAGTPFAELPGHWRCPRCDAAPAQFMALAGTSHQEKRKRDQTQTTDSKQSVLQRLAAAYESAAERMRGLPVFNEALRVEVVGSRRCDEGRIAVVLTPWMMNLTLLPDAEARARREGTTRNVQFPSGTYGFTAGFLGGFGALETCSLFSPMDCFDDLDVARSVGRQALAALFVAGEPTAAATAEPETAEQRSGNGNLSRRQLLRGRAGTAVS
jgi:[NiFe] hydrogenase assembly HybE family chaperone